jgi:thiamine biosynthesis protein ThiS
LQINVRLFGILRDHLPVIQKGRAKIDLEDGASIADLLTYLDISRRVEVAINEEIEIDETHNLKEGDQVHIFTPIGGG